MKHLEILGIENIEDDCVKLKNGMRIAVLSVKPVNFYGLKNGKRKKIVDGYEKWLDSLEYPVQITGRTINCDIEDYLKVLEVKIEHSIKEQKNYNKLLAEFRRFCEWLKKYISKNCATGRTYYVTIPYTSDKANCLQVLNKRADSAVRLLTKAGLKVKRLMTSELSSLYSSYFIDFLELNKNGASECLESSKWLKIWREENGKRRN